MIKRIKKTKRINKPPPFLSNCCGALPLGELYDANGQKHAFCSRCREHAVFFEDNEE